MQNSNFSWVFLKRTWFLIKKIITKRKVEQKGIEEKYFLKPEVVLVLYTSKPLVGVSHAPGPEHWGGVCCTAALWIPASSLTSSGSVVMATGESPPSLTELQWSSSSFCSSSPCCCCSFFFSLSFSLGSPSFSSSCSCCYKFKTNLVPLCFV